MNHKHILDLTLRLSQALDQNYDVVSMETVLSVISALEGATITKEQLEATRLAKYINQLRRRTKSDNLARRAKSLLKKWREMVGIQQTNESTPVLIGAPVAAAAMSGTSNPSLTATPQAPVNSTVTDNSVSISHLTSPPFRSNSDSYLQYQCPQINAPNPKLHQHQQHQLCHSQPTSPLGYKEKSNPNEFLNSTVSNPPASLLSKGGNLPERKRKKVDKIPYDQKMLAQQKQPPTSFANLLTGLGSSNSNPIRKSEDKCGSSSSTAKPMETFVIEHSSNSNSDLICMASNAVGTYNTSAKNVPPIVIDLQDTNSSMNSLVSKDVANASLSLSLTKPPTKKSKKEKKRKEREILRQNNPLNDCDDNNTGTNTSYHHQRPQDMLIVEEKSHSACPTISNISEILSLSNSSMSSVFPSTDAISKNIYDSCQHELPSSLKMSKSDLTFAGKFKQNSSSTSTACDVLNYNSDSVNITSNRSASPNKNKFTLFGGIGMVTNSSDSTSNSHMSQFNVVVDTVKEDASNSKINIEEHQLKHESNDKSMSNLSNKGNSSTDIFAAAPTAIISQQQHQSIDLTTTDFSSEQTIKQPKKRGRKKGSKGVDSVIAKETSLSSQMLISSLSASGKKVKTTKELYAEMQNRKLHNVTMAITGVETTVSPTILWPTKTIASQRASSCSDIAESDSCTMTSDPSRDSPNPSKAERRETPLDSNSNYSQFDAELKLNDERREGASKDPAALTTANIKNQMLMILKQLAPPPDIKDLETDSLNDILACTCYIIEIIPKTEMDDVDEISGEDQINTISCETTNKNHVIEEKRRDNRIEHNNASSVLTGTSNEQTNTSQQLPLTKPKKSIFDLDFDDDEDPLNSIIADIAGRNSKENSFETTSKATPTTLADDKSAVKIQIEEDYPVRGDDQQQIIESTIVTIPNPSTDSNIVFPTYEVKMDPDCKAKSRFDIQTQKITKFHIESLHNCYLPNVNGNWNHAEVITSDINILRNNDADLDIQKIMDGYNVVPCYGSEINEHIRKDLSQVKFTKQFKAKRSLIKNEKFNNIPFMGVSRILEVSTKPRRRDVQQRNHKHNLKREDHDDNEGEQFQADANIKEESENAAAADLYKIDNNSVKFNTISIDVKSAERETMHSSLLDIDNNTPLLAIAEDINIMQKLESNTYDNASNENSAVMEVDRNRTANIEETESSDIGDKSNQSQLNEGRTPQSLEADKSEQSITKLKRKNKTLLETNLRTVKRLKISINGSTETQNLISYNTSSTAKNFTDSESDYEEDYEVVKESNDAEDDENDYNHEVVSHDISDATSTSRKNLVLTIKKTPLKTSSPLNLVTELSTSSVVHTKNNNVNIVENIFDGEKYSETIDQNENRDITLQLDNPNLLELKETKEHRISSCYETIPYGLLSTKKSRLNYFKKRLKRKNIPPCLPFSSNIKLHNLLFFPDEICEPQGTQKYIFNISSCSSSSTDDEEEDEINGRVNSGKEFNVSQGIYDNIENRTSPKSLSPPSQCSDTSLSFLPVEDKGDFEMASVKLESECEKNVDDDKIENDDLPEENNFMLLTFNNINCKSLISERNSSKNNIEDQEPQRQIQQEKKEEYRENMLKQQLQNCDDYNNLYNSNFNLIKYIDNKSSFVNNNIINSCSNNYPEQHVCSNKNSESSSSRVGENNCNSTYNKHENDENVNHKDLQIVTYNEYHTGIREVDEGVDDDHGNNCGRLQQFKEWHEVLQLHSYNDELLTVLPYVVLE